MNTSQTLEVHTVAARRRYFPAINWGAIIAGIIVGMATQLILTLLGLAAGLSAMELMRGDRAISDAPTYAAVWQGVTMLISAFVGGYVAARMSGLQRKGDGMLHGLVAWGATTLLVALLATSAVGAMFGSTFSAVGSSLTQSAGSREDGARAATGSRIEELIRRDTTQSGQRVDISPQTMSLLQRHIQAGDRQSTIDVMVQSMAIPPERAAVIADQAMAVSQWFNQANSDASRSDRTETAKMASWMVFGAAALSMLVGIIGGLAGAAGMRRRTRLSTDRVVAA
ncbi:MAG: hypothetical protein ACM3SV_11875 [Betaproteobacteria bacterium]